LWPSLLARLREWIRAEAGAGRILPWVPVGFGIGIACYFAADHEPVTSVAAAAAIGFGAAAFLLRRQKVFPIAVMIAAMAAGFAIATWKTARIAHGVLARPMYSVSLSGFVETRDIRERTDRFVLRVTHMESPRGETRLERVRLSVRKGTAPAVGSFIELKARLQPPLAPLRPGSYDFGRDMYFQGIGASGFVTGVIKTVEQPAVSGGLGLRYAAFMQGLRDAIDARIREVLNGDRRAIATALLTGRRDAITTPVNDAMFISGLGHVLSISGYHMAVVAGVVFFAVRALLALIPALTVSFPIKKWSAAAALAAAAFYLLLSGAEVATQRSFFMTAVVLIAVMVDRRAVTFRTLAGRDDRADDRAGSAGASKLPDVVRRYARTGGAGADRHAALVRRARQFRYRAGRALGRTGDHDAGAGVAGGGTGDNALCGVSLPPGDALWRRGQSGGDAGGLGCGDARGPAWPAGDAVRPRRRVLAHHGRGHRLDDRGDAMGRGVPRRDWPHGGVRDRSADRGERGDHPAGAVALTPALARRRSAGVRGGVGAGCAAA
jgi:competence protein ComEC